jgi:hypothetical protein
MEGIYCVYSVKHYKPENNEDNFCSWKTCSSDSSTETQHQIVFQNASHIYLVFLLYMIGAINCNS